MKSLAVVAVFTWASACAAQSTSSDAAAPGKRPPAESRATYVVAQLPEVVPPKQNAVGPAEQNRIRALIARLADIDSPYFGLSATLTGAAFAPIESAARSDMLVLTDHRLKCPPAFRDLVALGPRALPQLLDALDDATPTKLSIPDGGPMSAAWFDHEMYCANPLNKRECAAAASLPKVDAMTSEVSSYTLTIGDVCLVAIGQIVNRAYSAIRYQPTACVVINSPTHDPAFRKAVRDVWRSSDPNALFRSLLSDLSVEAIPRENLYGWYPIDTLRCEAARRLLYYYPETTAPIIASRLDALDLSRLDPFDDNAFVQRCVHNGVRSDEFLAAVSWSDQPAVVAALRRAFDRADGVADLIAASKGVRDPRDSAAVERLLAALHHCPADRYGPHGAQYELLLALGRFDAPAIKAAFEEFARKESTTTRRTLCAVL
ncbi:MAG TPA: hypothetical protein VHC70_07175, partial [Phycisphaerales bacterium]|nr:hypothetical protein [Phycisphaerales bacterium]